MIPVGVGSKAEHEAKFAHRNCQEHNYLEFSAVDISKSECEDEATDDEDCDDPDLHFSAVFQVKCL